jgi:hypothetical protein
VIGPALLVALRIVNERRGRLDNAKTARVLRLLRGLAVATDADVEEEA